MTEKQTPTTTPDGYTTDRQGRKYDRFGKLVPDTGTSESSEGVRDISGPSDKF